MEAEVTGKVKKGFGRKIPKWAVISLVVFLILGAAVLLYFFKFNSNAKTAVKQQTTRVMKGDLSVTVTGSGPIISSSRVDVSSNETAAITKVYFKEGDTVKAGDLMFELDDTDARSNVEKIQDSISQTELSQSTDSSNLNKLTITAPFSGRATGVTVKSGDVLGKNASIFTLTDESKLKLTVPFNGSSSIKPGQKATVYIQSLMQSVEGTVSYVSDKAYSTATGGQIHDVDITVNNPGGLSDGMKANAEVSTAQGALSSTDNGTLSYVNSTVIRSQTGGTVGSINVKENQYVYGGDVLLQLSGDES